MLSSDMLLAITEKSALTMRVISTAWPSLAVESKLQILNHLQATYEGGMSEDIMLIAGRDENPIVRFWVAKELTIRSRSKILPDWSAERNTADSESQAFLDQLRSWTTPSEQLLALASDLREDSAELVRAAAAVLFSFSDSDGPVEPLSRMSRLLAVRPPKGSGVYPSDILEWVIRVMQDDGVAVDERSELMHEYLTQTWMKEIMATDRASEYIEDYVSNTKWARKLWNVVVDVPAEVAKVIVYYAPRTVEGINIMREVFNFLPLPFQLLIVGSDGCEADEVREMLKNHEGQYLHQLIKMAKEFVSGETK